jgi:DNA invertase Pin-like site-specific DNA recombinase
MRFDAQQKVTANHVQRNAYLYIRQSTLRQVIENTESTQRQYALKQQALRLGWPIERVIVIDSDLGQSGASAVDREGFQRLVTEVSLGHAGIVLGLEVSRLARNSTDWHRLLEICALTDTLILDEDGLYDPRHFNDRLLLGLKGTISEAELHVLRARLLGGIESKARRGELRKPLPVGLEYDAQDRVVLDPDQQVQQALVTFFREFERIGAAMGVVKYFRKQKLQFPRQVRRGMHKGQLIWAPLTHSLALKLLKNPRYAGCYVHGQSRTRRTPDGKRLVRRVPQDQWDTVLPQAHPGYITWEQYQSNRRRLLQNAMAHGGGGERRHPPREGPALLQGLALCGLCGQRMTLRYHHYKRSLRVTYMCQRDGIENGERFCQCVPGAEIDREIGNMLLGMLEPATLELSLAVQQELQGRLGEADRLRKQQVERVRYEADLARQRFMNVDPNNRLVASTLEAEWNERLRALADAQEQYEQQRIIDQKVLDEKSKDLVHSLAGSFATIWNDPQTSHRDRKRMVQLLIEDVTLIKGEEITYHIRFKGGACQTRTLPLPTPAYRMWETDPEIVQLIDKLLDEHTDKQIAEILNDKRYQSGKGGSFTRMTVRNVRISHQLRNLCTRLQERGLVPQEEMAARLQVTANTIKRWRRNGLLRAHAYDDKNRYLYEPVEPGAILKHQGIRLTDPRRFSKSCHEN